MEKNTGKTECLNYIINRLEAKSKSIALTSIGLDGENIDQVTETPKPEIEIPKNSIFVTSEMHYRQKKLTAEILDISERHTALGRLVTARAKNNGTVILSGPSDTVWLKYLINQLTKFNPDIILVDGAISRKSQGSPSVTDSIILTTGAALSANIKTIVKKTKFIHTLIHLDVFEFFKTDDLLSIEKGLWAIDVNHEIHDLDIKSSLILEKSSDKLFKYGNTIFISGILTDKLLDFARIQKNISTTVLIVKDFTKIFISPEKYSAFISKGGKIKVLLKTKLISVCVNPVSPDGFVINSPKLCNELATTLGIPVYDIKLK
ncbi:MAG TPA: hypothetical protein PLL66_01355 [Bacteroidales bacterium]|nr:hypothetical protein [Bacteroidales bacterium]